MAWSLTIPPERARRRLIVAVRFVGIMWIVFGGLLFSYGISKRLVPARRPLFVSRDHDEAPLQRQSFFQRATTATSAAVRRYLLPEAPFRAIFGRTTRLQVTILAFLIGYLTVFTFVGTRCQARPGLIQSWLFCHLLLRLPLREMGNSCEDLARRLQHSLIAGPVVGSNWCHGVRHHSIFCPLSHPRIASVPRYRNPIPELHVYP